MKTLARILLNSILSMLLASAIQGGIVQGIDGVLAAPFLMIYGWFYFPVVFRLNAIAFDSWQRFFSSRPNGRTYLTLIGGAIAAGIFSFIGLKEEGSERLYTAGYAIAASIAAMATCLWISSQNQNSDKHAPVKSSFF
jgi:hypothetical protein